MLALGWACLESAASGRPEHRPTSEDYPDSVVRRVSFAAGGDLGWRISALTSPRGRPAPWKIAVVTGAPSWAEYWAPVIAALRPDLEMVVVDRPGFACTEPMDCVPDIGLQAKALSPLLDRAPGQKILLVGQSYGAAVATLMAAARPRDVDALALLSSYLGEAGPTARWLVSLGSKFLGVIPRDLRNAVQEVAGQSEQMPRMRAALAKVRVPIHVIHGDQDDFAPIEAAKRLASESGHRLPTRFHCVPGANHFLNDGPVETLLSALYGCLPSAALAAGRRARLPRIFSPASAPGLTTAPA